MLVRFLERFPTAAATAVASVEEVAQLAGPLGLQERRPIAIIRFSREILFERTGSPAALSLFFAVVETSLLPFAMF